MSLDTKSRIIVLYTTKVSDSGIVVHTLDNLAGRRSFLLRGIKGTRHSLSDFHALSILDVVGSSSPRSSLSYLKEWRPVCSLEGIRSDIFKSAVAMFISEVIYRVIRDDDSDEGLFEWICDSVFKLNEVEGSVANFHLWFLVSFCTFSGFRPYKEMEPSGIFTPSQEELFMKLVSASLEEALKLPLSSSVRNDFVSKVVQYLSYHLGCQINIKSLEVLHEIFS